MRSGVRLDDFLLTKGAFGALRRVLHRLATMGMLGGSGQVPPPLVVEGIETTIEIGEAWIAGVLIVGAWIEEVLIGGARNAEVLTEEARNKEVFQEVDLLQALLPGVLVIQADLSQDQCLAQDILCLRTLVIQCTQVSLNSTVGCTTIDEPLATSLVILVTEVVAVVDRQWSESVRIHLFVSHQIEIIHNMTRAQMKTHLQTIMREETSNFQGHLQ